jgi:5-oxoprolinase (ATP-hydrolysing)
LQVKGAGKAATPTSVSVFQELRSLKTANVDAAGDKVASRQEVYVCPPGKTYGDRVDVPVFELEKLACGDIVAGPALIIDATQTIFINA